MSPITSTQLRRLLIGLSECTDQDRDILLTNMLVRAYPSETTQNN